MGYYNPEIANNGRHFKAVWDSEKKELDDVLKGIEFYIEDISNLMKEIREKQIERETIRVKDLVKEIVGISLSSLNENIAKHGYMITIRFDYSKLEGAKLEIQPSDFIAELKKETKKEKNPWLLWLSERHVSYATIPSADELHNMIHEHLQKVQKISEAPLIKSIKEYYETVAKMMIEFLDSIMADVRSKIDNTSKENKKTLKDQEDTWLILKEFTEPMLSELKELSIFKA